MHLRWDLENPGYLYYNWAMAQTWNTADMKSIYAFADSSAMHKGYVEGSLEYLAYVGAFVKKVLGV